MEIGFIANLLFTLPCRVGDLPLIEGLFLRALGLTDLSSRFSVTDAESREEERESGRELGLEGAFILALGVGLS